MWCLRSSAFLKESDSARVLFSRRSKRRCFRSRNCAVIRRAVTITLPMPTFAEIARTLQESLKLTQPPVAVCFADNVPPGVERWSGQSPAGCRFWQEAASRVFATNSSDHGLCSIGLYTHNLEMSPAAGADLGDALKVFGDLGYVRAEDIPTIPVLASKPKHVIYGPLAEIPVSPAVVLLFVRADQTLILSEASQQLEAGLPPAMGRPACAIIPQASNTGRSALSLGLLRRPSVSGCAPARSRALRHSRTFDRRIRATHPGTL